MSQKRCRHRRRLGDQQISDACQPARNPLIHRLGCTAGSIDGLEHLSGHPVRRYPGLGQQTSRFAVPGGADRPWHLFIQRLPDQRMPEPQAVTGLGQHAGGTRLVKGPGQVGGAAAQNDLEGLSQ